MTVATERLSPAGADFARDAYLSSAVPSPAQARADSERGSVSPLDELHNSV